MGCRKQEEMEITRCGRGRTETGPEPLVRLTVWQASVWTVLEGWRLMFGWRFCPGEETSCPPIPAEVFLILGLFPTTLLLVLQPTTFNNQAAQIVALQAASFESRHPQHDLRCLKILKTKRSAATSHGATRRFYAVSAVSHMAHLVAFGARLVLRDELRRPGNRYNTVGRRSVHKGPLDGVSPHVRFASGVCNHLDEVLISF